MDWKKQFDITYINVSELSWNILTRQLFQRYLDKSDGDCDKTTAALVPHWLADEVKVFES